MVLYMILWKFQGWLVLWLLKLEDLILYNNVCNRWVRSNLIAVKSPALKIILFPPNLILIK